MFSISMCQFAIVVFSVNFLSPVFWVIAIDASVGQTKVLCSALQAAKLESSCSEITASTGMSTSRELS